MRFLFLLGIVWICSSSTLKGQTDSANSIQWISLDDALTKSKTDDKKIMMFLYTDWCKWCKKMEATTFADEDIASFINENFHPVKFNAESKERIYFNDKVYSFSELKPRGVHGFAVEVMNGRISFPTISFFDENWELIQSLPNYQEKSRFEKVISYFAGNYYKKVPWSSYEHYYVPFSELEDR